MHPEKEMEARTMGMSIYELIDVCQSKKLKDGKNEIVKNVNMTVKKGEFICIMGPTGCGKSTLMRLLCGVDRYTDGILMYQDSEVKGGMNKHMLQHIGVAYQSDNLFEWQTVKKNIENPINIFGLRKQMDVEERLNRMLELTGLKNYSDCYPRELSGGMRQRCAFARALAHDPEVLLLDQPFGALDAITRKILGIELLKIWKEATDKTVIMVTNSVVEALMLAQRVIILSAAPATVFTEVINPLSYEERIGDLAENETFITLSEKLNALVHLKES
ncbi:MAG: ATP-binding cassette domain-containing protein [Roseburia faecis]|nr:ATP-binding cassette domain-containing protein [Roseburia faecis]